MGRNITEGSVALYSPNPRFSGSYARTDTAGLLFIVPPNGAGEIYMDDPPYYRGEVYGSASENQNFVSEIAWSFGGEYMAFVVSPPEGRNPQGAGVWLWTPNANPNDGVRTYQLTADCRRDGDGSCFLADKKTTALYYTVGIEWARHRADFLLVSVVMPDRFYDPQRINLRGIAVVTAAQDRNYYKEAPGIWFYHSGTWVSDGRILVSGHAPDGRVIVAYVTPNFNRPHPLENEQVIVDAGALGWWVQNAAVRGDGAIVALGRPIDAVGGALQLVQIGDGTITPISDFIGGGAPSRVEWANSRNSLAVVVGGVQYLVNAYSGARSIP